MQWFTWTNNFSWHDEHTYEDCKTRHPRLAACMASQGLGCAIEDRKSQSLKQPPHVLCAGLKSHRKEIPSFQLDGKWSHTAHGSLSLSRVLLPKAAACTQTPHQNHSSLSQEDKPLHAEKEMIEKQTCRNFCRPISPPAQPPDSSSLLGYLPHKTLSKGQRRSFLASYKGAYQHFSAHAALHPASS